MAIAKAREAEVMSSYVGLGTIGYRVGWDS